jgi:hypothetical protein
MSKQHADRDSHRRRQRYRPGCRPRAVSRWLIRAAIPHLRRQGGGRIVQVSSEGGQIAYPSFSPSHPTKWGIEGFIESVVQEVAPFGIDFVIVESGPTGTNFGTSLVRAAPMDMVPVGRPGRLVRSRCSRFIVRSMRQKRSRFMLTPWYRIQITLFGTHLPIDRWLLCLCERPKGAAPNPWLATSLWQMPAASTRTLTCPGPGSGTGRVTNQLPWRSKFDGFVGCCHDDLNVKAVELYIPD